LPFGAQVVVTASDSNQQNGNQRRLVYFAVAGLMIAAVVFVLEVFLSQTPDQTATQVPQFPTQDPTVTAFGQELDPTSTTRLDLPNRMCIATFPRNWEGSPNSGI
jgi:hypothetical protein